MKKYIFLIVLFALSTIGIFAQYTNEVANTQTFNPTDLFSYGVKWDQSQSTPGKPAILRVGNPALWTALPVQAKMRRCVVRDDGSIAYYLSSTNSWNKEGVAASITAKNPSSLSQLPNKILSTGNFADTTIHVGNAVKNVTQSTYAVITTVHSADSVTVSMPYPMTVRKWGTTDGTTANHLIHAGIDYTALGVVIGDEVWNRTDNTYAKITNVATGDLTLTADIMVSGEKYTIFKKFVTTGDVFEICTADLDGTDGQVMVEVPLFYYKYSFSGTTHDWRISELPLPGFEVYPWFVDTNGQVLRYRYFGAYEGYNNGGKLSSIVNMLPTTSQTRATFRGYATTRGRTWYQQSYFALSAVQLLYLTEYASWYSQSVIGIGATDWSSANWNTYNAYSPMMRTGLSNKDGNVTANLSNGDNITGSYMTYRGIENLYGHLWKWTDGINIYSQMTFVSNDQTTFADDKKFAGYFRIGITLPASDGYQTTLANTKYGFLPSAVGGSGTTYVTDYYYQSTTWRVVLSGGSLANGASAGVACLDANDASSGSASNIGSRLCK